MSSSSVWVSRCGAVCIVIAKKTCNYAKKYLAEKGNYRGKRKAMTLLRV